MKQIGKYSTYEEANDLQLTLLAAKIDAVVEYTSAACTFETGGSRPGYALMVEDSRVAEAEKLIQEEEPVATPGYRSMLRCPYCDSEKVKAFDPFSVFWFFGGLCLLGIPLLIYLINDRIKGEPFKCLDCGRKFREKP